MTVQMIWSALVSLWIVQQLFTGTASVDQNVCNRRWKNVLEHTNTGSTIQGSKSELLSDMTRGAQLRIHVREWGGTGGYTTDVHNAKVINNNVCAQTLLHISKSDWKSFQVDAYWWFVIVCSSGHVHMSRWLVGVHSFKSDTKTNIGLTWFTRELGCAEGQDATLYSHTSDGSPLFGNLQSLFLSLGNGHDVRVVEPSSGYVFAPNNMQWNGQLVAGQSIWHVSQTKIGSSHIEFQSDAYWWFTMWSTSGKNDRSRWDVGSTNARGHTDRSVGLKWIVDPCWTLAYEHDDHGNNIDGSLGFLKEAVLNGRRVKAVMGNYSIETDMITVRNGHVNAQLLGHISKADTESFQNSVYWYWEIISTTGSFKTYRYTVGSTVNVGNTSGNRTIAWFIDTRKWKHVLSNDENGHVTHGSKSDLVTAVQNGVLVRYALRFPEHSSVSLLQADNIAVNGNDVGAQSIRSISQTNVGSSETALQPNPYWWFTITSSTGSVAMSRWTVGQHQSRGNTNDRASVDWFINE